MKLEVGMYVRGKYYGYRGKIGKIIKNYNNDLEIAYTNGVLKTTVGSFLDDNTDINGRQYVASFNIIDLIEVGDAFKFTELRTHISNKSNTKYYENYIFDVHNEEELEVIKREIKQGKIKLLEILTKEQFEHESYKV